LLFNVERLVIENGHRTDIRALAVVCTGGASCLPTCPSDRNIPCCLGFIERNFQAIHADRAIIAGKIGIRPKGEGSGINRRIARDGG
jgi:hypothetical protein